MLNHSPPSPAISDLNLPWRAVPAFIMSSCSFRINSPTENPNVDIHVAPALTSGTRSAQGWSQKRADKPLHGVDPLTCNYLTFLVQLHTNPEQTSSSLDIAQVPVWTVTLQTSVCCCRDINSAITCRFKSKNCYVLLLKRQLTELM